MFTILFLIKQGILFLYILEKKKNNNKYLKGRSINQNNDQKKNAHFKIFDI